MHRRRLLLGSAATALAAALPRAVTAAAGRTIEAGPRGYGKLLRTLRPGDHLLFEAGVYRGGLKLRDLRGEPGAPITISGPVEGPPAVFEARRGVNTVSLRDVAHIEIRNLTLDGLDLPVDAVKAEGPSRYAHFITLERLTIVRHGANQQIVAISSKCPAFGWRVIGNRIEGAGTGMYFGQSNGGAPFVGGLIEGNTVLDCRGYGLQIKHQRARPTTALLPEGDHDTVIRGNVIGKVRNASVKPDARPNVLLGDWPHDGPGRSDRYLFHGNLLFENATERLLQAEGTLACYDNVLVNSVGDALRIQPHKGIPRKIWIFHNTIVAAGAGLSLQRAPDTEILEVVGNAVFGTPPLAGLDAVGDNLLAATAEAPEHLVHPTGPLETLDCRPLPGKLRAAQPLTLPAFPEAERDFAGAPHRRTDYGAFARDSAARS